MRINMLINSPRGLFVRNVSDCGRPKRNGDFIDIWYIENGMQKMIAIPEVDLRKLLVTTGHGSSVQCHQEIDEPANDTTLLKEFLRQKRIQELIAEIQE